MSNPIRGSKPAFATGLRHADDATGRARRDLAPKWISREFRPTT
jgi:hypothetical protein